MDLRFLEYGTAVCAYVRHATAAEKAAIRKELADHMEDHAQALIDGGFPEDHAIQIALESMGEAETVGRELDKEYPLRWLVLSRLALLPLIWILAASLLLTPASLGWLYDNLQSHYFPMTLVENERLDMIPLDIRKDLPGGAVLSVYGIGAFPPSKDSYTVCVGITGYNKNPFLYTEFADFAITFSHGGNTEYGGYADGVYQISGMTYGESLTLHFDHYGTSFDLDIPIPWEEVPQ